MKKTRETKPKGFWDDKINVLSEIKSRFDCGLSLDRKEINKEDKSLMKAIQRHYNSWIEAIIETEKYYNIRIELKQKVNKPRGYWNNPINIYQGIKSRLDQNKTLIASKVKKDDGSLLSAACKLFKTWDNALSKTEEYFDINIDRTGHTRSQGYWRDGNNIINEIKLRAEKNLDIHAYAVYKSDGSIYNAGCEMFGSWDNALRKAGFDPTDIRKDDWWTKESIKDEVLHRYNNGLNLSQNALLIEYESLFSGCLTVFGNYRTAIEYCGLNYDEEVREDTATLSYYGKQFELLLDEILLDLNIKYKKGFSSSLRPDYVVKNNVWMDAKLSEWSIYKCDTLQKYEPHCKMLNIIYLRGNKYRDEMITKKTRLISVYKLIKQMPIQMQTYYINKTNIILDEINHHATKQYIK